MSMCIWVCFLKDIIKTLPSPSMQLRIQWMIRHLVNHRNKDKATAVENEPDDGSPAKKGKAGKKILGKKCQMTRQWYVKFRSSFHVFSLTHSLLYALMGSLCFESEQWWLDHAFSLWRLLWDLGVMYVCFEQKPWPNYLKIHYIIFLCFFRVRISTHLQWARLITYYNLVWIWCSEISHLQDTTYICSFSLQWDLCCQNRKQVSSSQPV